MLLLLFGYLYYLNANAPFFADDYGYSFIWGTDDRVASIRDVFVSQYAHYFTWGGRSVAHVLAQTFLYLGKPIFDVANSLVFLFLILLIYWISRGERPTLRVKPVPVQVIFGLLWFSSVVFGETVLWLVGACNYLWTTVIVLAFLLPYTLAYRGEDVFSQHPSFASAGMFLLGILAGWSNENSAAILLLLVAVFHIALWRRGELRPWMWAGFLGATMGFVFLIAAPGNFARLRASEELSGTPNPFFMRFLGAA